MNIFDQLGITQDDVHWHDLAACKDLIFRVNESNSGKIFDPMFDNYENDTSPFSIRHSVDEMCLSCPVQQICYDYAVDNEQTGVWGGVYFSNGKIDKTRNSHKTKETWKRIKAKVQ